MNKWKNIYKITLVLLILFFILIIYKAILKYTANVTYPYLALGTDIYNWCDAFKLEVGFIMYILGIPLMIDVVLLVISVIMIMKIKNKR